MIGDNALETTIINTRKRRFSTRAIIDVRGKNLVDESLPGQNRNLRYSSLVWFIKYKPRNGKDDFILVTDIIKGSVHFASYEDLVGKKEKYKNLGFVLAHTNLSPELIEIAKNNIALTIPLGFDYVGYEKEVGGKLNLLTGLMKEGNRAVLREQDVNAKGGKK